MKKFLIVCPKPYIKKQTESCLKDSEYIQNISFSSCSFVTTANDELINLKKTEDGYFLNDKKTTDFEDLKLQSVKFEEGKYAISITLKENCNVDVDYVIFINSTEKEDILACIEFCERNEIPEHKAFLFKTYDFSDETLKDVFNIEKISPLFEIAYSLKF